MDLVGRKIKHKTFGTGTIIEQTDKNIVVEFRQKKECKKFPYPQCLQTFITFVDEDTMCEGEKNLTTYIKAEETKKEKAKSNIALEIAAQEMHNRKRKRKNAQGVEYFNSVEDFCDAYIESLKNEIAYLKTNGARRYKIAEGRLVENKSNGYVYTFESEDELSFPESTQISIWLEDSKEALSGQIIGCEEFTIIILSKRYLGKKVSSIEISAEPWKLLSALIERLDNIRENPTEIVDRLVCEGRLVVDANSKDMFRGQNKAIEMSCNQPITFIWGPPGTGKTHTLAEIALEQIKMGHRILMVSYSNVSVDGAILALYKLKKNIAPGVIVRYGYPQNKELLKHEYLTSYNLTLYKHPELAQKKSILIEKRKKVSRDSSEFVQCTEELNNIRRSLMHEEKESIKNAKFVATTISKAIIDTTIYESDFDTVIFDEASMAYIPQIIFAGSLAKKHFICMGDFKQLPPIVQSNINSRLSHDIFQYCDITSAVEYRKKHDWLCMLDIQYRMHPEIAEFASKMMYEGLLKSHSGLENEREDIAKAKPVSGSPIGIVDLAGMMSVCSKTVDNSRVNVLSAFVSMCIAYKNLNKFNIGIITPYHAQSRLLHAMSKDIGEKNGHKITCATVHQFQGSEQDIIIYDAVDCYRMQYPGMLLSSTVNDYANKLFNVALTRAKGKFIGVTNVSYMSNKNLSSSLMFSQMLQLQKKNKNCTNGEEIFKCSESLHFERLNIYSKAEGNKIFLDDIRSAKNMVRIDIPNSVEDSVMLVELVEILKELKHRNIKVVVRAESRRNLPKVIQSLAIENPYVVNPVTIIDKEITWFGEPASKAEFRVEGNRLPVTYRPVIRFQGEHTATSLYGFLEMNQVTDRSKKVDKDSEGNPVNDNFASYVLEHVKCTNCGKPMMLRKGRSGKFYLACTNYPLCSTTKLIDIGLIDSYLNRHKGIIQRCNKCSYSLEGKLGMYGVYVQCCGTEHHKFSLDEI